MPCRLAVSSAFSASESAGTAPRPSRSSGTKASPSARRAVADKCAGIACRRCGSQRARRRSSRPTEPRAVPPARFRIRQRCRRSLPACTARSISRRSTPNGSPVGNDKAVDFEARRTRARRCRCRNAGSSAPIIMRAIEAVLSRRGSQARHLPTAQHRRARHTVADLFELVADVEDAAALGGELAQASRTAFRPPAG